MRDKRFWILLISIFWTTFFFSGCYKSQTDNLNVQIDNSIPSTSSIEKVDFKNFTYEYPKGENRDFTLVDGEKPYGKTEDISFKLKEVSYADLTGDKENEAIVSMTVGLAVSERNLVYVYLFENNKPKVLWSFWTGERADVGLKKAYAENENLVIETFGNNKFENDKWEFDFPEGKFNGYCCPMAYTKIVFKWDGEKFIPFGERQVSDYDWKKDRRITDTLPQRNR